MGHQRQHKKWTHRVATEVSRTINGNLDGSLSEHQARHIITHALAHHASDAEIVAGFEEVAVGTLDGVAIHEWVKRAHHLRHTHRTDN